MNKKGNPVAPVCVGVIGCFRIDDGYPNVKYMLQAMHDSEGIDVRYLTAVENGGHFNRIASGNRAQSALILLRSVWISLLGTARSISAYRRGEIDCVYVPYPSIFSMLGYVVFPHRFRPPIAVDFFISLYDTMVLDRGLIGANSLLGRGLHWLEKTSLRQVDAAIIDTPRNAEFVSELFGVAMERLVVLPLMIDESCYRPNETPFGRSTSHHKTRVLFFGSFVPLHGIEVILEAAMQLEDDEDIEFTLIGDGQMAPRIESLLAQGAIRVDWKRQWLSPAELAGMIAETDICLGVFGSGDKAKRVWPLKNYMALRVGKCLLTGETSVRFPEGYESAFVALERNEPERLAREIRTLARDQKQREQIGAEGRRMYERELSNQIAFEGLMEVFQSFLAR